MLWFYIVTIILFFWLCFIIGIRLFYGNFWSQQPVYHYYDFHYIFKSPQIINREITKNSSFINHKSIESMNLEAFQKHPTYFSHFLWIIQNHYLKNINPKNPSQDNYYYPKKQNIIPYFIGHHHPSIFSLYTVPTYLNDVKTGTVITDKEIAGVMTSRPLLISFSRSHSLLLSKNESERHQGYDYVCYYVEFLCVKSAFRKKGIAPQLIATHEANQRAMTNNKIQISLFKKEEDLTGIVPLCVYTTYGFTVTNWIKNKPLGLPPQYKIMDINKHNIHLLNDFLKRQRENKEFDVFIIPSIENIMELVKTRNIYIKCVFYGNEIISAYFFRKSCVFIEKEKESITCFASLNGEKNNGRNRNRNNNISKNNGDYYFIQGFKSSVWSLIRKYKYGFCAIENISHNTQIVPEIYKKTAATIKSPTAYFFYNFIHPAISSDKVFILN